MLSLQTSQKCTENLWYTLTIASFNWYFRDHHQSSPYQLNTVTYGMACSPFLAIRSLQFIAQRKQEQHPIGASVLLEDMYVDDLLTGADSIEAEGPRS